MMPSWPATVSAVAFESPVSKTTLIFISVSAFIAGTALGRSWSVTKIEP
jgi:hypothetical protein